MSSGSQEGQESRARALAELMRELRQFTGLSASFFRAAAMRLGMPVTDLQVIDSLEGAGPLTAGQLADLTGLTTGAITGMLNRLEKSGLVLRERDPDDARRVIVRLAPGAAALRDIGSILDAQGVAWNDVVSHYSDEQIAFLVEFLKRGNAQSREEILRLRASVAEDAEGVNSAPLGDLASGRLVVSSSPRLTVRAGEGMADLYEARFEGPTPEVKSHEGEVTIRYPRRLTLGRRHENAEVRLNAAIPWRILIQGGAAEIVAELGSLTLAELEVKGGMNMVRLELPAPSGIVPIRLSGGASAIIVRRPADVAARVHLMGWVSTFDFDDQTFSNMGSDVRLHSRNYAADAPAYDITVASSASMVTITTDAATDDTTPRTR